MLRSHLCWLRACSRYSLISFTHQWLLLRLALDSLMSIHQRLRARIHWGDFRRFRWKFRRNRFFSDGFLSGQQDRAWKLDDPRARTHPIGARWWRGGRNGGRCWRIIGNVARMRLL
jgi:hypothetical protein